MKKAFTLIELMIVVAIIAIIAAIAIPNLLESKKAANESNAGTSLKSYGTSQVTYQTNNYSGNANNSGDFSDYVDAAGTLTAQSVSKLFADGWQRLGGTNANVHQDTNGNSLELINNPFGDASAALSAYNGYFYRDIDNDPAGTAVTGQKILNFDHGLCAVPAQYGTTGTNTYILDAKGVVYIRDTGNNDGTAAGTGDTRWPTADELADNWATW